MTPETVTWGISTSFVDQRITLRLYLARNFPAVGLHRSTFAIFCLTCLKCRRVGMCITRLTGDYARLLPLACHSDSVFKLYTI
jgi:hypothetical protein